MRKRVFIADDDKDLVHVLAQRCRQIGLTVEDASDGFRAGLALFVAGNPRHRPQCIILDVNMPEEDGLSLCEELSRDDRFAKVPVIILTGRKDWCTIQRCKELGARYVPKTGDVWKAIKPLITEVLYSGGGHAVTEADFDVAESPQDFPTSEIPDITAAAIAPDSGTPLKVLVVDDDHLLTEVIKRRLGALGLLVERAFNGDEGFEKALHELPDVIVTDYLMPGGDGVQLLERLRGHPVTSRIPVVFLTSCDVSRRRSRADGKSLYRSFLDLGAQGVLQKPVDYSVLASQIREHAARGDKSPMPEFIGSP